MPPDRRDRVAQVVLGLLLALAGFWMLSRWWP